MEIQYIHVGDEVFCTAGSFEGYSGTVLRVDPTDDTALVEFSFGGLWVNIMQIELCGRQAAEINIAFDDFLSVMEEAVDEVL